MQRLGSIFRNNDQAVQRYKNGVTLVNACSSANEIKNSITNLYNLPCPLYFMDDGSRFVSANDATAEIVGGLDSYDILGRTAKHFWHKEFSSKLLENDQVVIRSQASKVIEETGLRADYFFAKLLTFKFPWYYKNKIVGVFGLSINIDLNSPSHLSNLFQQIMLTGLLSAPQLQPRFSCLTKREMDVLLLFVRGKTAKEIGKKLNLSYRTAEHYIENIKAKTNCASKSELIDKFYAEQM